MATLSVVCAFLEVFEDEDNPTLPDDACLGAETSLHDAHGGNSYSYCLIRTTGGRGAGKEGNIPNCALLCESARPCMGEVRATYRRGLPSGAKEACHSFALR